MILFLQVALTARDLAVPRRPHLASRVEIRSMAKFTREAGPATFLSGLDGAKGEVATTLRHVRSGCACGRWLRIFRKRLVVSVIASSGGAHGLVGH